MRWRSERPWRRLKTSPGGRAASRARDAYTRQEATALIGVIIVLLFLGLDLSLVVGALLWLSERRSQADYTDMRFRGRWRRL